MEKIWESKFNIALAGLLEKLGLVVQAEKMLPGGKRHDIEVKLGSLTAVIEAEKGWTPTAYKSALADAQSRVSGRNRTADIALALCYPDGATVKNLKNQTFKWAIIPPKTSSASVNWAQGGLEDLAVVVLQLPNELGDPDLLADQLNNALDVAVSGMDRANKEAMAQSMDLPSEGITKQGIGKLEVSAKRALLVMATAIMFHFRLGAHLKKVKPKKELLQELSEHYPDLKWPPMSPRDCLESSSPLDAFIQSWKAVLTVDYRPIFETAIKLLSDMSPGAALTRILPQLAGKSLEIASQAAGFRHDLLGRIFHRILDTARFDGSFYTSTAAAALLASLALRESSDDNWSAPGNIGKLRIVDPACGTGTLLMASSERMRDLFNRKGGGKELEKILIEKVLYGYDTNLTATHLAATTLGLLSPGTEFANMNIERTLLGVENGDAYLGSLEFVPGGQPSLLGWVGGKRYHVGDDDKVKTKKIPKFDLVIMNPPYTRDSLRHDQFSPIHEAAMRRHEKTLLKRHFDNKTLDTTSQGNNFVVLAEHMLRPGGTLATVLPMVTATNPSSLGIRKFIADNFHIEMLIVSHDPKRQMFSENTHISEMLLICRKRGAGMSAAAPAKVINLARNPESPVKAVMAGSVIASNRKSDWFIAQKIAPHQLAHGDWSPVQFLLPRLFSLFNKVRGGEFFSVISLSSIGKMLNGRTVRGVFKKTDFPAQHGMIALWNNNTQFITAMAAEHDSYIDYQKGKKKQGDAAWDSRARFMLPSRLWLPLTRATSVVLSRPAVSSAWYSLNLTIGKESQRHSIEKALCLYLNSSVGILALLGVRDFKKLGYPNFSVDSIERLSVPDFAKLSAKAITAMAAAFDKHSKSELLHLRDMQQDDTRRAIDDAVAAVLGIPKADMKEIRELLPREPSVSGQRYEKLTLKPSAPIKQTSG